MTAVLTICRLFGLGFSRVASVAVKAGQKASDFLALESPVTPAVNAVCRYPSFVTPPPQGVRMDAEEPGYFPHGQHVIHFFPCHIFSYLPFN